MANAPTADNQSTKTTLHQRTSQKKNNPNFMEEDINYYQNLGTTTTTINLKNKLFNTLPSTTLILYTI